MNLSHKIVNMMFMLFETFNKTKYFKAMVTLHCLVCQTRWWLAGRRSWEEAASPAHLPTSTAQLVVERQPHLQERNPNFKGCHSEAFNPNTEDWEVLLWWVPCGNSQGPVCSKGKLGVTQPTSSNSTSHWYLSILPQIISFFKLC